MLYPQMVGEGVTAETSNGAGGRNGRCSLATTMRGIHHGLDVPDAPRVEKGTWALYAIDQCRATLDQEEEEEQGGVMTESAYVDASISPDADSDNPA